MKFEKYFGEKNYCLCPYNQDFIMLLCLLGLLPYWSKFFAFRLFRDEVLKQTKKSVVPESCVACHTILFR